MNCGQCTHWTFKNSTLKAEVFGTCKVEPDHVMRGARMFGPQHACTLDKFEKAAMATLQKREKALNG